MFLIFKMISRRLGIVYMSVIPALRGLGQEDQELSTSLGYVVSSRRIWAT